MRNKTGIRDPGSGIRQSDVRGDADGNLDPDRIPHPASRIPVRRVLMTADAVGGVWPYVLDLAFGLATRGIHVTVAVMGPAPRPRQLIDAARRGIPVVEGRFALEWMDEPWADIRRAGEWLLNVERAVEPDVVHLNGYCHAALPWHAPAMVVAHSCVRSWWRAVHGSSAPATWDRYTADVRDGLLAAAVVVAPTATMRDALQEEYGPLVDTMVIPNGSSCIRQEPSWGAGKSELVLAAGRIWDQAKNIETLCDVAPSIAWPVYVAGSSASPDGSMRSMQNVTCLGTLDREAMEQWYQRAAIYTLPARYEPFGLSVLEAAAASCALVLGDIASLRENWNGAALFVPPNDGRQLAQAVCGLIADRPLRDDLARRARERSRQFTVARMADGYIDAYDRTLRRSRAAERDSVLQPS